MKKLRAYYLFVLILMQTSLAFAGFGQSDKDFSYFADIYKNTIFEGTYIAPAYYAEYAVCEDVYCMFTEGTGYLHSSGYQVAVPVDNFAFLAEQIYKSNRDTLWHQTKEAALARAARYSYISDLQPGFNPLFASLRRFEMHGPIYNARNFTIEEVESGSSELVAFRFNQTRRVERAPYAGVIYFNKESGLIDRAELDQTAFFSFNAMSWVTAEAVIRYMANDNRVYIMSAEIRSVQNELKHTVFFLSEKPVAKNIVVSDEEYWRLSNQDINPFIRPIELEAGFESRFSSIPIAEIRKDLEHDDGDTLEAQFVANSGKPYMYAVEYNGDIHYSHGGQIIFDYAERVLQRIREK